MVLDAGQPHLKKTRRLSPSFFNFVYRGTHFCAMVAADRTTTETTRSEADQRKTTRLPIPLARDGSDIPILRDHISVASLGAYRGIIYTCSCRRPSLPVPLPVVPAASLPVVGNSSDMVVAAKCTQWHRVMLAWGVYFGDRKLRLVVVLPCRRSSLARHHS